MHLAFVNQIPYSLQCKGIKVTFSMRERKGGLTGTIILGVSPCSVGVGAVSASSCTAKSTESNLSTCDTALNYSRKFYLMYIEVYVASIYDLI